MAEGFCAVPDCIRPGAIELNFGNHYDARRRARDFVCSYHAGMAVDFFYSIGFQVPIRMTVPPSIMLDRTGRPLRYEPRKPDDNTEYDDPNARGTLV